MQARVICKAYRTGPQAGQSITVNTPHGTRLNYVGGCARVTDGDPNRDIPYLLRQPQTLEFEPNWVDWVPRWTAIAAQSAAPLLARVILPGVESEEVAPSPPEPEPAPEPTPEPVPEPAVNVFAELDQVDAELAAEVAATPPAPVRDAKGHFIKAEKH